MADAATFLIRVRVFSGNIQLALNATLVANIIRQNETYPE